MCLHFFSGTIIVEDVADVDPHASDTGQSTADKFTSDEVREQVSIYQEQNMS